MGWNLWFVRFVSCGKLYSPQHSSLRCLGWALSPSGFPTFWYIMTSIIWLELEESVPMQLQVTENKTTLHGMSLSHCGRFSLFQISHSQIFYRGNASLVSGQFCLHVPWWIGNAISACGGKTPCLQNSRVRFRLWNYRHNSCRVALHISLLIYCGLHSGALMQMHAWSTCTQCPSRRRWQQRCQTLPEIKREQSGLHACLTWPACVCLAHTKEKRAVFSVNLFAKQQSAKERIFP